MTYRNFAVAALGLVLAIQPGMALAYIGPGVGAGAIAAALGVIGSILLGIVAVLYYPIKRMLKRRKSRTVNPPADGKSAK